MGLFAGAERDRAGRGSSNSLAACVPGIRCHQVLPRFRVVIGPGNNGLYA